MSMEGHKRRLESVDTGIATRTGDESGRACLYMWEDFEYINDVLQLKEQQTQATYRFKNIFEEEVTSQTPVGAPDFCELTMIPYSNAQVKLYTPSFDTKTEFPYSIVPVAPVQYSIDWFHRSKTFQEYWTFFHTNEQVMQQVAALTQVTQDAYKSSAPVEKIVALGLPQLEGNEDDLKMLGNLAFVHLILEPLVLLYDFTPELYVQFSKPYNHQWTDNRLGKSIKVVGKEVLYHELPAPQGILEIDGKTMVVCLDPEYPARQILGDLMKNEEDPKIPAALLCRLPETQGIGNDEPAPRLAKLLTEGDSFYYVDIPANIVQHSRLGGNFRFYFRRDQTVPLDPKLQLCK